MSDEKRLTFTAALAGTNTHARWLSVGSEGDAKVTLELPASELAAAFRLASFVGQAFRVTVETE